MFGRNVEHLLIVLVAYYLGDRCRLHPPSAVRDRCVGRCHVQRGDLVRAEYDGRLGMFRETRGDPASPCDVRDLLRSVFQATASGVHRQVREHRVIRLPERLFQADLTPLDAVIVLYLLRLRFVEADIALVLFLLRDVPGIGSMPCSRAAMRANGLNELPSWRLPWVTRLNSAFSFLSPTMVFIRQVPGSMETRARSGSSASGRYPEGP